MRFRKGEVYLANLGKKSEHDIGKIRPVAIFQNDLLNKSIERSLYRDVIILPLSSKINDNEFAYVLKKRDNLEQTSQILCNALKMISAERVLFEKGLITKLSESEMREIEIILYKLFDCRVVL